MTKKVFVTNETTALLELVKAQAEIKRLRREIELKNWRAVARRMALALKDAYNMDYPWYDGSRAEKALAEADRLGLIPKSGGLG
jgi:hypothetical protein